MKKSLGFTLAEVLITLAIIGVVAAMTVPSVMQNTNQQEFKTGYKKALTVLNQAITMNMAMNGESPEDVKTGNDTTTLYDYFLPRLNVASVDADAREITTKDGFTYIFPEENADGCAAGTPCYVIVDINGAKGPNKDIANGATPLYKNAAGEEGDAVAHLFVADEFEPNGQLSDNDLHIITNGDLKEITIPDVLQLVVLENSAVPGDDVGYAIMYGGAQAAAEGGGGGN